MAQFDHQITKFKSEARSDLRGHLKAAMARPPKWLLRDKKHMDTRVIKVAGFKSEVKLDV